MGGQVLNEATWRGMFKPLTLRNGRLTGYGLGWTVRPWNGHFAVNHGGSQPETRTQVLIFPAEDFAVAIACNLEGTDLIPYIQRLVALALGEASGFDAYAPDRVRQSIYLAASLAFDHGLSAYLWMGSPVSKDRDELRAAFDYFGETAAARNLERDYEKAKERIQAGIHPVSKQMLTKVGSYMAWALEEANGRGFLRTYHRRGPVAFFNDYIQLSKAVSAPKRHPRFREDFSRLMAQWENDWAKTFTEEIGRLVITPGTDFESLVLRLKAAFAGASICPYIGSDLAETADSFLKMKDGEKAVSVLTLGRELYPASPSLAAALGYVLVWNGRAEEARRLYFEARELDPTEVALGAEQFIASMRQLVRVDKKKEAEDLGLIAVEIRPKEPVLYTALGDLSRLGGSKEKAAEYFRKALEIDPNFDEARSRLRSLEK
jgi:tetratricopeptide (TPR) repeat protein